jgi:dTDP-4-amino-4,6-dideoxygalactose transaminase
MHNNDFKPLFEFEKAVAEFFDSPFAIATDCCTHALEMCLRLSQHKKIRCPKQTYISIPFMLEKINVDYTFVDSQWEEYYYLKPDVIDAATFWKKCGYIKHTKMCISFHIKKHINIGKGGMILLDDEVEYKRLQKMRYDGRSIYDQVNYENDDISEIGYHYYMTPETAEIGLKIFDQKKYLTAKSKSYKDYSDVTKCSYFKNHE